MNRFKTTRNKHRAWQVLLAHIESDSYVDNLKSSAMNKISTAVYNGEKKKIGIVKYYQTYSEAHNDLAAANKPLSHGMKITHFLQGIKEDTAMNFAISSKSEGGITNFEEFYNSFSAKLSTKLTLTQPIKSSAQRNISQIGSSNDNNSGRGNKGIGSYRGGGRDRNEYQRRGYRGRR